MKLFTIISLLLSLAPISSGEEFKSLKINYAAKARFVEKLSEVKLAMVKIEKLNLSAAISRICKGGDKEGDVAVVNYVVSFPAREIDADPLSDNPTKKAKIEKAKIDPLVVYRGSDVSFTTVLDSLCAQAGYVWSVGDDGKGHTFILIEYKGS